MQLRRGVVTSVVTMAMLIPACGGGSTDPGDVNGDGGAQNDGAESPTPEDDSGNGGSTDDGGASDSTGTLISVDGVDYMVDTELGGSCSTEHDAGSQTELTASGFDSVTGKRVELSFRSQSAETSPSGEDEYYGGLSIASGGDGQWQVATQEPWDWIDADRSRVIGTVTMEDSDGGTVEVTFDVECP